MEDYIYCRYSSDMQRAESCADQERDVRADLPRFGVFVSDPVVLYDEAESGTKTGRDVFQQLSAKVAQGKVRTLAVDDQSRLTRAENAYSFIKNLVFRGGRFISTKEGIDTNVPGWELKVQVLQLHHGQTIRDLQHRVRRGQRGRVEADGSAGDFPYGYESYYLDADWQAQLARRGPKPKKGIRINEDEAKWVRAVFDWFVDGRSIGWIARELTRLGVPKGRRTTKAGWHPQQVHRMLTNAKYVGRWAWGTTTTIRNSDGDKKQVDTPIDQQTVRERPNLRIVGQDVWYRTGARLAELSTKFGFKDGQKRRGPKAHPTDVYPRSPLGGILICGSCRARLWQCQSNGRRYYACPGAKKGLCSMTTQVPADRAEGTLTAFLLDLLRGWPEWVRTVYRLTREAIQRGVERVPDDRERDSRRSVELTRQIDNLVDALADGRLSSDAVNARLSKAEAEKAEVDRRLAAYADIGQAVVALPDEAQVMAGLAEWAVRAASMEGAESLLHMAVESAMAEAVTAPGKKRGFVRLRFRVNSWGVLMASAGRSIPSSMFPELSARDYESAPEFTLDLGAPSKMDRWAPQIVAWREAGVPWKEIVRRTGLDLNRAFIAWKRCVDATGGDASAA
jgi:DNA invertase Pin-like site-specific DNA recombinase